MPVDRLARYAAAATLARFADEMVGVSVVLLVLGRTGSPGLAGAAVAGYTLPAVLTGPLLGAWLARAGRAAILALAGNELVLACVTGGLVLAVGHVPGAVVVALTFAAGVSLPLTSAGFSSLLPGMVGRAALDRANTLDAMSVNAPAIGGPALAGTLAATAGPGVAVLTIGVVALLATVATCALSTPRAADVERAALLRVVRDGLRHLATTPPLRAATLTSVLSLGCAGLLVVALPAGMARLAAPSADAGYVWAALELGGLAGILLLSARLRGYRRKASAQSRTYRPERDARLLLLSARLRGYRRKASAQSPTYRPERDARLAEYRPERVVFGAVGSYGVLLAVLALMPNLAATLAVAVVAGVAEGPCLPAVFAARQRYTPDLLLAQVSTSGASLKIGAFALGSVLSGTLTGLLGPVGMLLLAAGGQVVAAGAGWLTARTAQPTLTSDDDRHHRP
jgi:MFS family permease